MEVNVSYHWLDLHYSFIGEEARKRGQFSPIAEAVIMARFIILSESEKDYINAYKTVKIPITGTMEPKQEIIQGIQKFAAEKNIEIQFDYLDPENELIKKNSYDVF